MKPISTEKAVKMIEIDNVLVFEVDKRMNKDEIKKEFEKMFNVKIRKIRTLIKKNTKLAYLTLDKKNPAIDVATKLGLM